MPIPLATQFTWLAPILLGLVVGSFLNVVIYRLPRGQSVVTPRSYCPNCGRFIRWWDNIPILSFLLLKGRCRHCRKGISPRYPVVEALSALLSLAVFWNFSQGGWLPYLTLTLLLAAPLVAVAFIDMEHKIIPDWITIPGIIAGVIVSVAIDTGLLDPGLRPLARLAASLIGAAAGGMTLFSVGWLYERIRGQAGIGMGDVKLAAMLGAFFGWKGVMLTLFMSSLLGSLVGIVLLAFFRKGLRFEIPYGPFIAGAALANLFFGQEIIAVYLRLTGRLPGGF